MRKKKNIITIVVGDNILELDMTRAGNYLPRTEQWIVDTLATYRMGLHEAVFYQLVINQGYITWTVNWIADLLKVSPSTLKRMLKKLEYWGFIVRKSIVAGINNRERVVTVALFAADGSRRTNDEIEALINEGIRNIRMNDAEKVDE